MTLIYVSKLATIGLNDGLSPGRRQSITWTNAGILLIRTWGRDFFEIFNELHAFSLKNPLENVVCTIATILYLPQYAENGC